MCVYIYKVECCISIYVCTVFFKKILKKTLRGYFVVDDTGRIGMTNNLTST
jgi:hypothetical protein